MLKRIKSLCRLLSPVFLPAPAILSAIFFCAVILAFRVLITRETTYSFLAWNLFLAWVPLALTNLFTCWPRYWESRGARFIILVIWMAFLPNAYYLVTDLVHLSHISNAPKWYDIILVFSFAWTGLVMGVTSLRRIDCLVRLEYNAVWTGGIMPLSLILVSTGVYMGRHLRFNSWEVFTQPLRIADEMLGLVLNPLHNAHAWGAIFLYSILFLLIYMSFRSFPAPDKTSSLQ